MALALGTSFARLNAGSASVKRMFRGSTGVWNADAADWIKRVEANSGSVSTATANAVTTFCNAIDAAGIRDKFYRLNLFCGTGLNACLVPLYRGPSLSGTQYGNATDTNNGPFVSGDYVETGVSSGLTGNGSSKHLDTGVNADIFASASFSMSVYQLGAAVTTTERARIGVSTTLTANQSLLYYRDGATRAVDDVSIFYTPLPGTYPESGLIGLSRTAANDVRQFNGSTVSAAGTRSAPPRPAVPIFVFAANNDGAVSRLSAVRLAGYHIGAGMSGGDISAFNTAISAFVSSLSRT